MRCAIFTSTAQGLQLAKRVQSMMNGTIDIYGHKNLKENSGFIPYSRVTEAVTEVFDKYSALIFIMATGIVVRAIAPHLKGKLHDPAVVVMDEKGLNIISLLSGHIGGANELTKFLAKGLGANPVITTATDINNMLAPDLIASRLGLMPYPTGNILSINSAILKGAVVEYIIDKEIPCLEDYINALGKMAIHPTVIDNISGLDSIIAHKDYYTVVISDKDISVGRKVLLLKPRRLIAGVGCRRGVGKELVLSALDKACNSIDWQIGRIDELASAGIKADEQGLLAAAAQLKRKISFYENDKLAEKIDSYNLEESEFVKNNVGVGNVSEAAAYCCCSHGALALPKTKFEKVTVALVWEK
ncbi:MAG: cobalamin biosynthesis protein [Anaerovibrio sp.]|uniref:cobalt-precorrin 5A hydrolase n=1 Tax=Anaerovibrio sp. TaxID=1872532 RepID=UPI0025CE3A78|nr:cobalamin biosynthesis protein [Anaerovibrio sp.]MCR5177255.1 cobalamin biosynthesis protein [Anaerovibrio sp.]